MDNIVKETFGLLALIVGVAILAVLVSKNADTSRVIQSFFGGFGNALNAATAPVVGSSFQQAGGYGSFNGF